VILERVREIVEVDCSQIEHVISFIPLDPRLSEAARNKHTRYGERGKSHDSHRTVDA
jgi:hypothetical protein